MAEACDRYQPFVVTSTGLTVADPFGVIPTNSDYSEWLDLIVRFNEIIEANVALGAQTAWAAEDVAAVDAIQVRYDALPSRWNPFTTQSDIYKARDLAVDAACALGIVEDHLIAYQIKPVIPFNPQNVPREPDSIAEDVAQGAGLGVVLLLGVAFWWFTREK